MPRYFPDPSAFLELARQHPGARIPVYRQLLGDRLTPVTAFSLLTAGDQSSHAFLLESVTGGEHVGRFSFLGVDPSRWIEIRQGRGTLHDTDAARPLDVADPLQALRDLQQAAPFVRQPRLPGFTGGLVGYAGYDLVRYYEPGKLDGPGGGPADDRGLPDLVFGIYDATVIFDHADKTVRVVANADLREGTPESVYEKACAAVDALLDRLAGAPDIAPGELDPGGATTLNFDSSLSKAEYEEAVRRGVEYIRAGDIFQFVPSMRLRVESTARPFDVYRALRVINPSPFMVYLRTPACTLIGNSPEILCRVQNRTLITRPLAGTRPRGATASEDEALAAELLADPKERSEHVMLVDLHRNDVGRVARTGTVRVDDLMTVERYSHVMHITTNVSGELDEPYDAFDALRVSLPVGTVSGAPKVRAMQIIDEVEPVRRGPYAGAVGHIDFSGDMDTCIALRTIVYRQTAGGGVFDVQAGAGVVADSVPEREYEESMNKARAMLKAVELAETGFQH